MKFVVVLSLYLVPLTGFAAISINEVAWMGSSDSANHEWIELYNSGTATNVDGWVLTDNQNLTIELTGTIAGNSYAVLERTSDASAPGSAFLIYTGALVNIGGTLVLRRSDDSIEDQVAGGEDWQNIGGDNVTKETAQYTSGGWFTAAATPGSVNASVGSTVDENDQDGTESNDSSAATQASKTTKKSSGSSKEPVRLVLPNVELKLDIDAQALGYVNQTIAFDVEPAGLGKTLLDSLSYQWNFGDGSAQVGKQVSHVFQYPGKYVVTLYATYARHEQVGRHEITILPVTLSMTRNRDGDIQLNNDSPYDLDISGYVLKGERDFVFPDYSIVLPNQTITIPHERVGGTSVMIAAYDTEGILLASHMPSWAASNNQLAVIDQSPALVEARPQPRISATAISAPQVREVDNERFAFAQAEIDELRESAEERPVVATTTQVALVASTNPTNNSLPYLGLIGLLSLGIFGLALRPSRNQAE